MKALLAALLAALVAAVVVLSGLAAPAEARSTPAGGRCDNPQYPACPPTQVGLLGPSRAAPQTRVPYTCSIRGIGTTAKPVGTFTLRVGRAGKTWSRSGPRRVPDSGRAVIRTPRLPRGNYNVTCTFTPRSGSIFRGAKSSNRRLLVRRHSFA